MPRITPSRNSSPPMAGTGDCSGNIWPSSGACRSGRRAPSLPALAATRRTGRSRRSASGRMPGRRSLTTRCWNAMARPPASSVAGWKRGGPTRSVCTWRISAIRCWGMGSMAGATRRPGRDLRPLRRIALNALIGQALHAAVLGFEHPVSGKPLRFEAPLPAALSHLQQELRLQSGVRNGT